MNKEERKFACRLVTVVGSVRLRSVIEIMRPVVDTCPRWWYLPSSLGATHRAPLLFLKRRAAAAEVHVPFLNKGTLFVYVCLRATDISCLHKGTSGISESTLPANSDRSFIVYLTTEIKKIVDRIIPVPTHV